MSFASKLRRDAASKNMHSKMCSGLYDATKDAIARAEESIKTRNNLKITLVQLQMERELEEKRGPPMTTTTTPTRPTLEDEVLITTRRPATKEDHIEVLTDGWVRLSAVFGDEQFIAESARQSTSGTTRGEAQDRKLLARLWRDRHTSPFEMCSFTYTMKAPLFVVQQLLRHRTGKFNQFSFRYSDGVTDGKTVEPGKVGEELDFYVPPPVRLGVGPAFQEAHTWRNRIVEAQQGAVEEYRALLANGVPSELARIVLPAGVFTRLRVQMDTHNLLKFLLLRTKPDVQWETRQYAWAMWELFRRNFPSLGEHVRADLEGK